jgi:hypothetical protein
MPAAFPTALAGLLERKSVFEHDNNVKTTLMDDGEAVQMVMGDSVWVTVRCIFGSLTAAEYATLRAFFIANRTGLVTWTIDGVDYEGRFTGGWRYSQVGNRYSVTFTYRAKEV